MDPNWNVPSEREWTIEEQEEFFSSRDAITGLFSGAVASNATWSNAPKPTGIHLTSITPPEQGWPIMAHCKICKKTVIVLSLYAAKPEKGDIWSLKGTCLDENENIRHNMYPQHDYPWPSRMGPRPEEWTAEAYKHYWNPLGVPK